MSVSYKVIGRHIQEARKRMKLTQREIAEKLNMSDTYYGKIERGECPHKFGTPGSDQCAAECPVGGSDQRLHGECCAEQCGQSAKAQSCQAVFRNCLRLLGEKPQPYAARMQRHCAD